MGETQEVPEVIINEAEVAKTIKVERRNGMGNIFEGVDINILAEKLGLSQEMTRELMAGADESVTDHISLLVTHLSQEASDVSDSDCTCERARLFRSLSATVGEEMQAALQNRQRRNAVGNLFENLSPSQKLLLVERLQSQLDQLTCVCGDSAGNSRSSSVSSTSDIMSSLSSLSLKSATSSRSGSPRSQSEIIVCP